MLRSRGIPNVRIWPRGVDLELFGPHRRNRIRRQSWGVEIAPQSFEEVEVGNVKVALPEGIVAPLTPPPSPDLLPADEQHRRSESVVVLYVGRVYVSSLLSSFHASENISMCHSTVPMRRTSCCLYKHSTMS